MNLPMIARIIGSVLIRTDEAILENEQKIYAIADILCNKCFFAYDWLEVAFFATVCSLKT